MNPEQSADYVAELKLMLSEYEAEVQRLRQELRRLYGQFRLALRNGEELLNDGDDHG